MSILSTRADPGNLYNCDSCGACCRTFPILATSEDSQRESRIESESRELEPWLCAEDWKYQLHPLPFLESCPFLSKQKLCSIYATRPNCCRRLEAGGIQCQEARKRVGLEPLSKGELAFEETPLNT